MWQAELLNSDSTDGIKDLMMFYVVTVIVSRIEVWVVPIELDCGKNFNHSIAFIPSSTPENKINCNIVKSKWEKLLK